MDLDYYKASSPGYDGTEVVVGGPDSEERRKKDPQGMVPAAMAVDSSPQDSSAPPTPETGPTGPSTFEGMKFPGEDFDFAEWYQSLPEGREDNSDDERDVRGMDLDYYKASNPGYDVAEVVVGGTKKDEVVGEADSEEIKNVPAAMAVDSSPQDSSA